MDGSDDEKDRIDAALADAELRQWAALVPGPRLRIYRLRAGEGRAGPDRVARIGGTPRGVAADEVPRHHGRRMRHALTLDLAELPELAARHPGARALALYLPGSDLEAGALVPIAEASLGRAPGSTVGARPLEVEPFEVPAAIFADAPEGSDDEVAALELVREAVFHFDGYALGGPLWVQEAPTGHDPTFVLQLGEGLLDLNLGDGGLLYVFEGQITTECH